MSYKPAPSPALIAAQKKTLARIGAIADHFDSTPGSGRLAGRVCIITGAGSEKGIG